MKDMLLISCSLLISIYSGYLLFFEEQELTIGQLNSIATIDEIQNEVKHKHDNRLTWNESLRGTKLCENDTVFTGEKSTTVIKTDSGIEIFAAPNTLLRINSEAGLLNLDLKQGMVDITFLKRSKKTKIMIKGVLFNNNISTSAGFRLKRRNKKTKSEIKMIFGKVKINDKKSGFDGQFLEPGKMIFLGNINELKEELITLRGIAPKQGQALKLAGRQQVTFKWNGLREFSKYELNIKNLTLGRNTTETVTQTDSSKILEDGEYSWTISAEKDGSHFVSDKYYFRVKHKIVEQKLKLTDFHPYNGYFQSMPFDSEAEIEFSWKKVTQTSETPSKKRYILNIYKKNSDGPTLVKTREINKTKVNVTLSIPGNYYWQVYKETKNLKLSEVNKIHFKIDFEKPPAPKIEDELDFELINKNLKKNSVPLYSFISLFLNNACAEPDTSGILINWKSVKKIKKYIIKIYSAKTRDIVLKEEIKRSHFLWKDAKKGKYIYRVASIDKFGRTGKFSRPGKINITKTLLTPVKLIYPKNKKSFTNKKITYKWSKKKRAKKYQLIIKDLESGETITSKITNKTKLKINLKKNKIKKGIKWYVISHFNRNLVNKSEEREIYFKKKKTPLVMAPKIKLLTPANGKRITPPTKIKFTWSKPKGVKQYIFQLYNVLNPKKTVTKKTKKNQLSLNVKKTKRDKNFKWSVRGVLINGKSVKTTKRNLVLTRANIKQKKEEKKPIKKIIPLNSFAIGAGLEPSEYAITNPAVAQTNYNAKSSIGYKLKYEQIIGEKKNSYAGAILHYDAVSIEENSYSDFLFGLYYGKKFSSNFSGHIGLGYTKLGWVEATIANTIQVQSKGSPLVMLGGKFNFELMGLSHHVIGAKLHYISGIAYSLYYAYNITLGDSFQIRPKFEYLTLKKTVDNTEISLTKMCSSISLVFKF